MRAAYGEGLPPYELTLGWLCDRYHKTPEEIERSDMTRILRMIGLVNAYDVLKKHQRGDKLTPEEFEMVGRLMRLDHAKQKPKPSH